MAIMIRRDSLYVGSVIECYEFNDHYLDQKEESLKPLNYVVFRSILFRKNETNLATDVLYKSPEYPILGITEDIIVKKSRRLIHDAIWLEPLLRLCGYPEFLGYDDVLEIREIFFKGNYVYHNCQLFGLKQLKIVKLDEEIIKSKKKLNVYLLCQKLYWKTQKGVLTRSKQRGLLPPEMGEAIVKLSDRTTSFPLIKENAFLPNYEVEGFIRKR